MLHDEQLNKVLMLVAMVTLLFYVMIFGIYKIDGYDHNGSLTMYCSVINSFPIDYYLMNSFYLPPTIIGHIYGNLFNIIGWDRMTTQLVSLFMFMLSLGIWHKILIKLNLRSIIFPFLVLSFLLEPYFSMANHIRVDSFVFLIISLVFYLFLIKQYFFSSVLFFIGIETHPTGAVVIFYILPYIIYKKDAYLSDRKELQKSIVLLSLGSIIGIVIFIISKDMPAYLDSLKAGSTDVWSNYFYTYFFKTKYYRHLPELLILLILLVIHIKEKIYKSYPLPLILLFSALISSFIIKRDNFQYVVFCCPAILIFMLYTCKELKKVSILMVMLTFLMVVQYGYIYIKYHDFPGYDRVDKIVRNNVPYDRPILADITMWTALRGQRFMDWRTVDPEIPVNVSKLPWDTFYFVGIDSEYKLFTDTNREKVSCNLQHKFVLYKSEHGVYLCNR